MMLRIRSASAMALGAWLILAADLEAQSIPRDLPSERWTILAFSGADAGYTSFMRAVMMPDGEGAAQIHSIESSEVKLGRLGSMIEIQARVETWERLDGTLIRQRAVSKFSANESISEAEFLDGKVILTTTTIGKERKRELECPPGILGPYALEKRIESELANMGKAFELTTWSSDHSKAMVVKFKILGPDEVDHNGAKVRAVKVEAEPQGKGVPKSMSWYGEDGIEIRTEASAMGMQLSSRLATREEALAATKQGASMSPDVFTPSMVVEPHYLPAPRRSERAVVRIMPRENAALDLLEDERQHILGRDDEGKQLLELRSLTPPPGLRGTRPIAGDAEGLAQEVAEALKPNSMIQSDAPEVIAIANEVVSKVNEAWSAAQQLEAWVEANLTDKNMGVAFASALEVCRDRSGDCSEHAVLLAALCRAAGIPARVSMGLLYTGGIWGGHAWNEVWIDGHWYALDATLGLGRCDALHLTLSKMTLNDGGFAEEFAGLLENLGRMDLEVIEMSLARWVEPRRDTGRVIDGWYHDEAWGLRFQLPAGSKLEELPRQADVAYDLLSLRANLGKGAVLRLQVRGYDASNQGGFPSFLGDLSGTDLTIDGRPAMRIGDESLRRVLIRAGAKVFEFKFTRVREGATEAAYHAILSSIDFDSN